MEHRHIRALALCGLSAASTLLGSEPAQACGGFFCSQQAPVNQAAERIVFADNGDGTITAVIQIYIRARRRSSPGCCRSGASPTKVRLRFLPTTRSRRYSKRPTLSTRCRR